ncbi:MAG TPA: diacylglycerol kinase family protein, partial [Candidatus Thermoplasmatota archaeon]|nr:diacylglycerol kinase family protein [Candidatus Thermoplasmatota archaeon]
AFHRAGARPTIQFVPGASLRDAAAAAVAQGADVVAAAGGDGTVSAVAGALAGTSVPLAVLPMGTLNHFAKDAGIPLPLAEAATVAAGGQPGLVDVGDADGRTFLNNVSIGIYPEAVRERDRVRRPGEPKALAMVRASGSVLRTMRAHHLLLSVDGRPAVRTTSFVFIGNNAYDTSLGRLGRRERLDGGRLCVYTVRRPGRRAVLGLAARALVGRLGQAPDLERAEATKVELGATRATLRAGIDGELARLTMPSRVTIRPRALRVLQEA